MISDLQIFRLIKEGMASLIDLEQWWSLDDLLRAVAYLDMMQDLTEQAQQKVQRESGKRIRH